MWAGNASCTHAETKRKKKPTPKINGENGLCSILRKLPVSPCLQLGLAPLQQGQRACSRVAKAAGWRWEIRTLALLSFPCPLLCSSPAAPAFLALTPWHPSSRGRRAALSDGKGLGGHRPLLVVELQKGPCPWLLLAGAAAWGGVLLALGVLPSSKDAPKPLSISRCVNMANLFYSFSVHYTQLYIYIYTYISLYIDIYRYTHIYYLRLSL